ncbi:hypothetical protein EMCRGX_G021434 [Ephydatia muelleri]
MTDFSPTSKQHICVKSQSYPDPNVSCGVLSNYAHRVCLKITTFWLEYQHSDAPEQLSSMYWPDYHAYVHLDLCTRLVLRTRVLREVVIRGMPKKKFTTVVRTFKIATSSIGLSREP